MSPVSTLLFVVAPLASAHVPSPAEAVLSGWGATLGMRVAQAAPEATEQPAEPGEPAPREDDADAPRRAEEEDLEQDMDRAREALGHEGAEEPAVDTPAEEKSDDPHAGHDHGPGDVDRYDKPHGDIDRYDPRGRGRTPRRYQDDEQPPARRMRHRVRIPPGYQPPLHEGRGKAYYLTWGIVDWAIAGGSWAVGLVTGLTSIGFASIAGQDQRLDARQAYPRGYPGHVDGTERVYKRDYRRGAVVTGVVSGVLALVGGYFAWRATGNIDTYSELKQQQRLDLMEWRRQQSGR